MSKPIRLIVRDGRLYFPTGDRYDSGPSMLIRVYPAGDCDTCPWPLASAFSTEDELRVRLACALFDERESNATFPNRATIELPDGEVFDFDPLVP